MGIEILLICVSFLASLVAVRCVYFKVLRLAKRRHFVDNPNARKLQTRPVPVMGGLAVFLGLSVGLLISGALYVCWEGEPVSQLLVVFCATVILQYVGIIDDISGLSPRSRILVEVITLLGMIYGTGECIDNFHGMWGIGEFGWYVAVPLTVFGGVGIINSVNMIDGVNGLSSGLCILSSFFFGVVFARSGDIPSAILAFSVVGSLIPFFVHNVFGNHSRMFIGDGGTMMMGVVLTYFTIHILNADGVVLTDGALVPRANRIAMALAILSVPISDTLRVMIKRIFTGRNPFSPDKRHLHHLFIAVGASHLLVTVIEILMNVAIVFIWWCSVKLGAGYDGQLYVVIASSLLLIGGTALFIQYHIRRHTRFMHFLAKVNVDSHLGRKEWWRRFSKWLDSPEGVDYSKEDDALPGNDRDECRKVVLEFVNGKAEVMVDDILKHSGVASDVVMEILGSEVKAGRIVVIKCDDSGRLLIVAPSVQDN